MTLARVVSFEGVTPGRIAELQQQISAGERPEGLPAREVIVLHDREAEKSLAIVFFETEEDYAKGDAVLGAMPAGETPGRRRTVERYEVAIREAMP